MFEARAKHHALREQAFHFILRLLRDEIERRSIK
jgi:hypothetical protein